MEAELQEFQQIYVQVTSYLIEYSFQILGALIIVILGYLVARKAGGIVEGFMVRHHVDVTLSRFTGAGIKMLLVVMVAIIAMGKLGITVTPFVAAVAALTLCAGLA